LFKEGKRSLGLLPTVVSTKWQRRKKKTRQKKERGRRIFHPHVFHT